MLKSQRGLTFLICIITIIVLIIIGAAATTAGIATYRNSKVKVYVSEMKMIQEKINLYIDRAKLESTKDISTLGYSVTDESLESYTKTKKWLDDHKDLIAEEDYPDIRFIDISTESAELGLKEIARPVFYNYKTKKLYSYDPALLYKTTGMVECYTLDQISGNF